MKPCSSIPQPAYSGAHLITGITDKAEAHKKEWDETHGEHEVYSEKDEYKPSAPTIEDCLHALTIKPNNCTEAEKTAGEFFLKIGLLPLASPLKKKRSIGKFSWDSLGSQTWVAEMATAATFIEEASALENIVQNICCDPEHGTKKRSKMITKGKMPKICDSYSKHITTFRSWKDDNDKMEVLKLWEKHTQIYREPEESAARKRSKHGPPSNVDGLQPVESSYVSSFIQIHFCS